MNHRRTNKSKKVPNVKLRPAEPGATAALRARQNQAVAWAHDSEGEEGNRSINCPRPFKGVVLCATGLEDKTSLFKQALELGATPLPDLTDRVTHLLATESGSPKYKCAVERKITIMHPSWVTESYETWLRGDDVDLAESVAQHRLPIFAGVTLSLSGIDDIPLRTQINKLVTQQGGTYLKHLERPVRVTHLLCAGTEETDKMHYAEKFNRQGEARISLVWDTWFWDCLDHGGRFGEEDYQITSPRPDRKSMPTSSNPFILPSPTEPSSLPSTPAPAPEIPRAPDASADDEELVSVRRVPALTLQVWHSVLRTRGFELAGGRLVRSPSKSQTLPLATSTPCPPPLARARTVGTLGAGQGRDVLPGAPRSALASFSRAHSFAPKSGDASTLKSAQAMFRRASKAPPLVECSSFLGGMRSDGAGPSRLQEVEEEGETTGEPTSNGQLFAGLKFVARGEADCENVESAIRGAGGVVLPDMPEAVEEADYIVVRLVSGSPLYRAESDLVKQAKYRTECWLERCIFAERICSVQEHIAFAPIPVAGLAKGGASVRLSCSGLDQSETFWVRRLATALGLTLAPNFSRKATHLLCPSAQGAKFDKAREWRIPVVGMSWLEDIVRTGAVPLPGAYLAADGMAAGGSQRVKVPSGNGKGKERAAGTWMTDITNSVATQESSPGDALDFDPPAPIPLADVDTAVTDDDDDSPFGPPNGLLGPPPLSASPPPPSSSQSPESLPRGSEEPHIFARPLRRVGSSAAGSAVSLGGSVPSLGGSVASLSGSHASGRVSPVKAVDGTAKALQEELANLLGKRGSIVDEAPQRPGKRTRPVGRTRSGQDSLNTGDALPTRLSPPSFASHDMAASTPRATADALEAALAFPTRADIGSVVYEDPAQRDERERLMKLFRQNKPEEVPQAEPTPTGRRRPTPRRATRKAGF